MGDDRAENRERMSLLGLLERAVLERDAASQLVLSGGVDLAYAAAFHIVRGWHALATVHARLSGEPDPDLEAFKLADESEFLAPVGKKKLGELTASFNRVRDAAMVEPWFGEAGQVDLRDLRLQIRLLGRCISAQRRGVIASTPGGRGFPFGWRPAVIALAVAVIAFIAIDLGERAIRGLRVRAEIEREKYQIPAHKETELDQLQEFKPRGSSWDAPGITNIRNSLTVLLGETRHPDTVSISLDGNDRYVLRYMAGENVVGISSVGPSEIEGLEVYALTVPEHARAQGFDRIVIEVDMGDGAQSVGHLLLNGPTSPDGEEDAQ